MKSVTPDFCYKFGQLTGAVYQVIEVLERDDIPTKSETDRLKTLLKDAQKKFFGDEIREGA